MPHQKCENQEIYDVVIIGAGISGSYAAYTLKKRCKNIKILILEAKDRVGGRTFTTELKCSKENKTSKWDLGGQWVCKSQKNINRLLQELGLETYKQYDQGKNILEINKRVIEYTSSNPHTSLLTWLDMFLYKKLVNYDVSRINPMYPYENKKLAKYLETKNFKEYLFSRSFTSSVRSIIISNMRGLFGLDPEQINTLFGLTYIKSGGGSIEGMQYTEENCAQESRVKGGTQQIARKCLDKVFELSDDGFNSTELLLKTALLEINQNEDKLNEPVEVIAQNLDSGEKSSFFARKVISSIPVNQYVDVKFNPELQFFKRNCFKYLQTGHFTKFVVTYKRPFWKIKGFSGQVSSDGSKYWIDKNKFNESYKDRINKITFTKQMPSLSAVTEIYDITNEENEPALTGFIAGKCSVEWSDQSEELRRAEVIEDIARIFGDEARDFIDYQEKNWSKEPFNGGCPALSVVSSGVMEDFSRATREPFLNVHFCGTESATQWMGYMDGAVESGERAANEVLYTLYQNDKSIHVDYEKTYYHQKEKINQIITRNNQDFLTSLSITWSLLIGSAVFVWISSIILRLFMI